MCFSLKRQLITFCLLYVSVFLCFGQEDSSSGHMFPGFEITETEIAETEIIRYDIIETEIINTDIIENEIYYWFPEYIDGVGVINLRTQDYIDAHVIVDSYDIDISKVFANLGIGTGVMLLTAIIVPAITPGMQPTILVVATKFLTLFKASLAGAAISSAISGVTTYVKTDGNLDATLKEAVEGAAEGYKWSAVIISGIEIGSVLIKAGGKAIAVARENVRLASQAEAEAASIPQRIRAASRIAQTPGQIPQGYIKEPFKNVKNLLPYGDDLDRAQKLITYEKFVSKTSGESFILGSDGSRWLISGKNTIIPFDKVQLFRDAGGQLAKNSPRAGTIHPRTGVRYIERYTYSKGKIVRTVTADFNPYSVYEVKLPFDCYKSDSKQARHLRKELAEAINKDKVLRAHFNAEQRALISKGKKPSGYVWHHTEDPGRMILVPENIHTPTFGGPNHTGGDALWGQGSTKIRN